MMGNLKAVFLRSFVVLLGLIAAFALAQQLPSEFHEAPMLSELVEAGELPPVAERLPEPEDIMVIEPVEEIGQYGGTLRQLHNDPGMGDLKLLMYDPGVRWNRDYTGYIPGLFRDWEFNEDGTSVTFFMRRGVKWSDGHPYTTEDILFWWEDLALNEDFGAMPPPWWAFVGEERAEFEVIDDYTFRFNFPAPNWNLPYVLAQGNWEFEPFMSPKHYMSQFHPRYNEDLDDDYGELTDKLPWMWNQNPGQPTLFAWHTIEYSPGERAVFERNPYYWKVDTEGNQLPYIDSIVSNEVPELEVRVLRIIGGEVDLSFRGAENPRNIPVIAENEERGNYRWLEGWINGAGGWPSFFVNQDFVGDDYIRELLRDPNFRRGLSHAIDREAINEVIWFGFGTVQQGTITEQSYHFQSPEGREVFEEWANAYIAYDVELANEYLDAAGLDQRDGQGRRLRADNGEVFELIIDVGDWGGAELNAETSAMLQRDWQAVGLHVILNTAPVTQINQRTDQGFYMLRLAHMAEMDLWTFPDWVFPTGISRRAFPLQSLWYATGGVQGVEPTEVVQRLYNLYQEGLAMPDIEERHRLVWEAVRIHIDEGPFYIGITGGLPMPAIANVNLRNIPDFGILGPLAVGAPGNTNPEQYFYAQQPE
jgi:peptide/nickel transport system substrate-binding protein